MAYFFLHQISRVKEGESQNKTVRDPRKAASKDQPPERSIERGPDPIQPWSFGFF